ncbi:MAG: hypothetical protein IJ733_01675 [Lachnospiraceae bacterium]|nr:hypothetical protein [Lachnospiraceae bacterium]
MILDSFTKEYIIEKRLFAYIPFYIARYEKEIVSEKDINAAVKDLEYFRDEMYKLHEQGELGDIEIVDLMGFVNTIITHISDGNSVEERLVNIMGGTVIETESERLMREAREDVFEIMDAINNGADTLEALEELGYKKDVAKAVLKKMQKVV